MSRARVMEAYAKLAADGVVVSHPQDGFFVAGQSPDGDAKRVSTGRYRRYYRCSSHKDVNVPEDEANEHIATVIADHLCKLWQQGGFTRRITEERAGVQSELKDAYAARTMLRVKIKAAAKDPATRPS